jgi:chromosome segregation ATPase
MTLLAEGAVDPKQLNDWLVLGVLAVGWIVSLTTLWNKTTTKVNGLGGRVRKVEDQCSATGGRMDRFERELAEYRRDAQDAVGRLGRLEKAVEDVIETVNQGNLQLGSQLHGIERLINEKDGANRERLVRLETVSAIEKKIGPLSSR